jgi:hypothetical protein
MITAQEARELNRSSYQELFERQVEPSIREASTKHKHVCVYITEGVIRDSGLTILGLVKFMRDAGFTVDKEWQSSTCLYELRVNW